MASLLLTVFFLLNQNAFGVITMGSGDPANNTTPPTGELTDSGWQWIGQLRNGVGTYPYVCTLISSNVILGAKHLNYGVGSTFTHNGVIASVIAIHDHQDPWNDARLFILDHNFPSFAPLCEEDEAGKLFVVIV